MRELATANFVELRTCEIRRIPLLSNTVNKGERGRRRGCSTLLYGVSACLSKPLCYWFLMSA